MNKIKVIDLFAGPGGLGEGFARFQPHSGNDQRPFKIVCSAEKDPDAAKTLRLRTFYRLCKERGKVPDSYFKYIQGKIGQPYERSTEKLWKKAEGEASTIKLGTEQGDRLLKKTLEQRIEKGDRSVLIGGPPCQAYSLVGRARNRGVSGYSAKDDTRHFLYEHYLHILAQHRPVAFVMENVKGLLSSRVGSARIFPKILEDLVNPGKAAGTRARPRYRIHALAKPTTFSEGDDYRDLNLRDFVIQSELYGIPQARHRVILLGVRVDANLEPSLLRPSKYKLNSTHALQTLPKLRSGISRKQVTTKDWQRIVHEAISFAFEKGLPQDLKTKMESKFDEDRIAQGKFKQGSRFVPVPYPRKGRAEAEQKFLEKILNSRCGGALNHEARNHMPMDLVRYLFATTYAEKHENSPKAPEFPKALAPNHRNWKSGKFTDRFRVQLPNRPSTTVTSHLSKDGHYFIHYDPIQCRSLTVREAARLQTFPDDYFFEGSRTSQYIQVGNAVPPILAEQIAELIWKMIEA